MDPIDTDALEKVLDNFELQPTPPLRLVRLDGGYSWRTYRVTGANDRTVILRLAPNGGTMEPYDPAVEARTITAAAAAVPTPPILLVEQSPECLGAAFSIHGEISGESVRPTNSVSVQDQRKYREEFAGTLGRIHAVCTEPSTTITRALRNELQVSYEHYTRATPWVHPGFEIGYRWLSARVPISDEPAVLCHGDYRLANLLWTAPGELSGVLDWERAWMGDPMCDVAFTRLFSGWCSVSGDSVAAYQHEAGLEVDEDRVEYGARFERWRSFTSSIRGMRAVLDGRNSDPRLMGIGLSGDSGAWDLVDWLEPDLPPLHEDRLPATRVPQLPKRWFSENRPSLLDRMTKIDDVALRKSLDALATQANSVPGLREVLIGPDPESVWNAAFALLANAARSGGPELIPALKALAVRARERPRLHAGDLELDRD